MAQRELDTGKPASAGAAVLNATLVFVDLGVIAIAPPTLQSVDAPGPSRDVETP